MTDLVQGYTANRNRTLNHLYSNNISNTAFLAGDSHANWSDLVWLDKIPYDQVTGAGAIGVEFAGTAVSSSGYGAGRTITGSSDRSAALVRDNKELQWTEGYYRGYYELYVSPSELTARYYGKSAPAFISIMPFMLTFAGSPSVATRNPFEVSLANFTVKAGANHLQRNVANASVESGALQRGKTVPTNWTLNTVAGTWNMTGFNQMFIQY